VSDETIPLYNPYEPAHPQEGDWDCSQESTEWGLYAYGRTPDGEWMEQSMQAAGVINPAVGLTDASGAGLASWLNTEYGEYGYVAESVNPIGFDELAAEASTLVHPIMAGGRAWCHWTGVRGYDAASDVLLLANPADGWMGIYQTMTRGDFARLGSFSMVRLTHPVAEGLVPPPDPEPEPEPPDVDEPDYAQPGQVGSGILEMMAADSTKPAMPSTFLPLGVSPAIGEWAWGLNGVQYVWHLPTGRSWRYPPA